MLQDPRLFRVAQRWLLLMMGFSLVVGILLLVAGATPLFAKYNQSAADAFYGGAALEGAALAHHQWLLGVSGAGTMGWAVTLLFVIAIPFERKELWAWRCVIVSVGLWVAVDVAASVYWGVTGEVAFVASAGIGLLVPALITRPHFAQSAR